MPKLIGLKEFQQNTKRVREEVSRGVEFIVIYRSEPVFGIVPLNPTKDWMPNERYAIAEKTFSFWNSEEDDDLFEENP